MALPLTGSATNYYLSNAGSDSNNGTSSATPWQTLAQLNLAVLLPGDSVLFEAGGIFRGEIMINSSGTVAAKIYFGSYGNGTLPVISGAEPVTGWSYYGGNTYKAGFSQSPAHLFADDEQMTIARYPNSGYLIHQDGISNTGFIDTLLTQPNGYWNGATVRIRTTDRLWEITTVDSFSNDTVIFNTPTAFGISNGYGYYLDNLFSLIDTSNEWFYDSIAQNLYFIAPGNIDPSSLFTEASVYDYGLLIQSGSSYLTIENIQFEKQMKTAIFGEAYSANITIDSSVFRLQGETGIQIPNGSTLCSITGNDFFDINGLGISIIYSSKSELTENTFKRIGVVAGYGALSINNQMAIECNASDSMVISKNDIDSIGGPGLFAGITNSVISKNILNYCLLNTNSLGSIYIYGGTEKSSVFKSNFVQYTIGNVTASPNNPLNTAGIYLDIAANENTIDSNTITYATTGLLIASGSSGNSVRSNVIYGCTETQMKISEGSVQGSTINNTVIGNTFYALHESADVVQLISFYDSFMPALFDSNYYFNPYAYALIKEEIGLDGSTFPNYFTLDQWQKRRSMDLHSYSSFLNISRFKVTDTLEDNLIDNSFFTNNFDGWVNFQPDTLAMLLDNSTPLDQGCLKINFLFSLPDNVYGPSYSSFQLDSGALYQLHLSNYSVKEGNVIVKWKEFANSSGQYVVVPRVLPFDETTHNYNCVIQPFNKCEDCYLTLDLRGIDSIVWVDNITLYPVIGVYEKPEKKSRLFINQTNSSLTFDLGDSIFFNLNQLPITATFTLGPYSAAVMIFDSSLILSVDEYFIPQLPKIFPNPVLSGGILSLYIPQAGNGSEISICDLQGKRLFNKILPPSQKNFQIKIPSFLSAGTYYISVKNEYEFWSGKILVLHL
ncbi:MAG: right-handed parallel beta-helix repeat-containing protein [Chitinophagales bacterium]